MTLDDPENAAQTILSRLPRLSAEATRAERTRQRCRVLLDGQRRQRDRIRVPFQALRSIGEPAILGAFGAFFIVYVGALVATAIQLQDLSG
jgi:hypothetical protein